MLKVVFYFFIFVFYLDVCKILNVNVKMFLFEGVMFIFDKGIRDIIYIIG